MMMMCGTTQLYSMKRFQTRAFHFPHVKGKNLSSSKGTAGKMPNDTRPPESKLVIEPMHGACPKYDSIVLSSGGVRGIAHLGALHVLHTHFPSSFESVRYFVGSSAGAVVAAMLALGHSPRDAMDAFVIPFTYKKDIRLHMLSTMFGLENGNSLETFLASIVDKDVTFKDIHDERDVVLSVLGTNLHHGTTVIFDAVRTPSMSVFDALRISCSVPLLFSAYKLNGEYVCDGAISDPFPVERAMDTYGCTKILGLRFDTFSASTRNNEWSLDTYLGTVVDTMIHSQSHMIPRRRGVTTDIVKLTTPEGVSGINFDICAAKKYDIFDSGAESMVSFLKKKA
jgi:predicted acylesterase/phospholipase RssA